MNERVDRKVSQRGDVYRCCAESVLVTVVCWLPSVFFAVLLARSDVLRGYYGEYVVRYYLLCSLKNMSPKWFGQSKSIGL
jgi:hypothetical protein